MEVLIQWELLFSAWVQNLGLWLEYPMQAFSFLGNEMFFLLIMPAIYWSFDPLLGFRAGMMLVISGGLNSALKMFFHTPRPYWVDPNIKAFSAEASFGLPSGHAQTAASIWGMLGKLIHKKGSLIIAAIVIFLIGLSRIYLGVHFLHDVLTGWLIGILILIIYLKLEKPIGLWLQKRTLLAQVLYAFLFSACILILGLAAQSTSSSWSVPAEWISLAVAASGKAPDPYNLEGVLTIAGVAFGFTAGFAWWRSKNGFEQIPSGTGKRLARYGIGLTGILVHYLGLGAIFPDEPFLLGAALRYLRYALIGAWVTALAPWCFNQLHLG